MNLKIYVEWYDGDDSKIEEQLTNYQDLEYLSNGVVPLKTRLSLTFRQLDKTGPIIRQKQLAVVKKLGDSNYTLEIPIDVKESNWKENTEIDKNKMIAVYNNGSIVALDNIQIEEDTDFNDKSWKRFIVKLTGISTEVNSAVLTFEAGAMEDVFGNKSIATTLKVKK